MKTEEILENIGLSKNEISIYLTLLKYSPMKAHEISKESKIPRTFVYELLGSLTNKGLIASVIKSGVKYFEAAPPEKLNTILEEKKALLKTILPELNSITKRVKEKPSVEVYEGKEGLKTILESILRMPRGSELYAYANNDIFEKLEFFFPNFVKRRIKKGIRANIIQEVKPHLVRTQKKNRKELRKMRFLNQTLESNVFIWQDNIAHLTLRGDEILGVVIKNKTMAKTQKQVFDIMWESGKIVRNA